MISGYLQDDLGNDLKRIFKNSRFKNEAGELKELNIFSQGLPIESNREDDEYDPFPYLIVRINSGEVQEQSAHQVSTVIIIGIYNDDRNNQGHRDVLHIINKIYERFAKDNVLEKKYIANESIKWTLQDEDTYPYYFGGMEIEFDIPAIRREHRLA